MKNIQDLLRDYADEISTQRAKLRSSRRYSYKFKKAAVRLLKRKGITPEDVCKALDITIPTLRGWNRDLGEVPFIRDNKPLKKTVKPKVKKKASKKDINKKEVKKALNKMRVLVQNLYDNLV